MLRLGAVAALLIALALLVAPSLPDEGQVVVGGPYGDGFYFMLADVLRQKIAPLEWVTYDQFGAGRPQIISLSPHGNAFVVGTDQHRFIMVDLVTGRTRNILQSASVDGRCCFDWSSDGSQAAYVEWYLDDTEAQIVLTVLDTEDLSSHELYTVTATPYVVDSLSLYTRLRWSPDGETIAFPLEGSLHLVDVTNGTAHIFEQLDFPPGNYEWSPDSNSIAFEADGALRIFDVASQSIAEFERMQVGPSLSWSSDSQYIFSASFTAPLLILKVATGEVTILNEDEGLLAQLGQWSPRSNDLAYNLLGFDGQNIAHRLLLSSADGSQQHRIVASLPPRIGNLTWSQNGEQLAYAGERNNTFSLVMVNVDGSNLHQFALEEFTGIYWLVWRR